MKTSDTQNEMTRRELLQAALAAGLGLAGIVGCQQAENSEGGEVAAGPRPHRPRRERREPPAPAGTGPAAVDNGDGTLTVPGGGKLASGTALAFQLPGGEPALLVKTKAGQLAALSAICTHANCTLNWDGGDQKLHCPCHGSVFDTTGKAQKGPAETPLRRFAAQVKGDDAVFTMKTS